MASFAATEMSDADNQQLSDSTSSANYNSPYTSTIEYGYAVDQETTHRVPYKASQTVLDSTVHEISMDDVMATDHNDTPITPESGAPPRDVKPFQASINIIKSVVGAGSFSLPYAFLQGGMTLSFFLTLALGVISAYTISLLYKVDSLMEQMQREHDTDGGKNVSSSTRYDTSYPEVAERMFPGLTCRAFLTCQCRRNRQASRHLSSAYTETHSKMPSEDHLSIGYTLAATQSPLSMDTESEPTTLATIQTTKSTSSIQIDTDEEAYHSKLLSSKSTLPSSNPNGKEDHYGSILEPNDDRGSSAALNAKLEHSNDSTTMASENPSTKSAYETRSVGYKFWFRIAQFLGFFSKILCCGCLNSRNKRRIRCGCFQAPGSAEKFALICSTSRGKRGSSKSFLDTNFMAGVVYFGFCATSIGASAAYVDFIAATLPTVVTSLTQVTVVLIMFPIVVGLALLRSFRYLAFTSILGDIAVALGILTVILAGFLDRPDDQKGSAALDWSIPQVGTIEGFFRYFGSTAFLFAVHIIVHPVLLSMKEKKKFPKAVNISYVIVTIINAFFGVLGVLLFSYETAPNVVDNLHGGLYTDMVKILLCVDLLFTIPMVMSAARTIIEDSVVASYPPHWDTHMRNFIRFLLSAITVTICFLIPNFGDLVTLVGGVVNCLMGFILPPMIYMKLRYRRGDLSPFSAVAHSSITIFGIIAAVASLVVTVQGMVSR